MLCLRNLDFFRCWAYTKAVYIEATIQLTCFFIFYLFTEGIFRAHLLELEKENSQANGVSKTQLVPQYSAHCPNTNYINGKLGTLANPCLGTLSQNNWAPRFVLDLTNILVCTMAMFCLHRPLPARSENRMCGHPHTGDERAETTAARVTTNSVGFLFTTKYGIVPSPVRG